MRRYRVTRDPWTGLERAIDFAVDWFGAAFTVAVIFFFAVLAIGALGR